MANRKLDMHPLNALLRTTLARTAAGALGAATPLMALANPTGGQVVAGSASISNPSANGTVVNQNSQRAVIDWQSFSVGSGQYVQFIQPNSSSVVLNKVVGGSPSSIFGDIKANGQVFLVNPNGIYFAPGSSIDVQGLVASTLDMDSAAFMRGKNVFHRADGSSAATVVNQGSIVSGRGGYVVLAGDYVQNDGSINALAGRVVLAAGNSATLTLDKSQLVSYVVNGATLAHLAGVENTGTITANGGGVIMTADVANALTATAVNNSGVITAQSARNENGSIVLLARGGDIENSGTLDASAAENAAGVKGGKVIIRGDGHTQLTSTSRIDTSGNQAHGGFIELSGHTLGVRGGVKAGRGGNLLIDPASIDIVSGGASGHSPNGSSIGTGFIENALDSGSNVTIVASNKVQNTTGINITATGTGNLTIAIGTAGGGSCIGGAAACVGSGSPSIGHTPGGGTIDLTGLPINIAGKVTLDAAGNADSGGNLTTVNVKGQSVELIANQINVNGNLTATNGDVNVFAHSGNPNITITGTVTANNGQFNASFSNEGGANIGTIHLNKVTALGIHVNAGIISASGTLHATGAAASSSSARSVVLHASGTSVEAGPQIHAKRIISDHGNINLVTSPGNFSPGSSVITVNNGTQNALSAANGSVEVFTSGNSHFGGNINITGGITGGFVGIDARGLGTSGGKVTINGNIVATRNTSNTNDVSISAADTLGNGSVNINGTITSARGVSIRAQGGISHITVGGIHANTLGCPSSDCNGGQVTLDASNGVVNANGDIVVDQDPFDTTRVSLRGNVLNFGNITATGGSISMSDRATAAGGGHITQVTGKTLKAAHINIDMSASYGGAIVLSNLTASSAAHPAGIEIKAQSPHGGNTIKVTGAITVDGKGGRGFSSGMPGIGLGMPVGAYLVMNASGSSGSLSSINVGGAINVTAHAGAVNYNQNRCFRGTCESGPEQPGVHGQVTGGLALVNLFAGGATGKVTIVNATVKGPDAILEANAATIKTGALTVAGSGHNMQLSFDGRSSGGSLTNNIGEGLVRLNGTTVTTGNIVDSGRGSAMVQIGGATVTTGAITVTASAAHGSREGSTGSLGSSGFARGMMGLGLSSGSFTAGRADVIISGNGFVPSSGSAAFHPMNVTTPGPSGSVSQAIKTGAISVNGVGEADINLAGNKIQTLGLSAVATAGILHGTGTSSAGGEGTLFFDNTFTINGGEAHIGLFGGLSSTSAITVTGGISVTGPTAGVDANAHTVKVSGNVSATGKGGTVDIKQVFHGISSGYTTRFIGPGDITGVNIGGLTSTGSVNIGGTVTVKGQGLVGVSITGQNVTLGGLSASASAARNYSILDTRVSSTPDVFTAGSVAILVFEGDSSGITGPAAITGNLTLNAAHGNAYLPGELTVGGTVTVTAAGGITTDVSGIAPKFNEISDTIGGSSGSDSIPSSGIGPLTLKAAGVSLVAGGNVDLTSANITATGNLQVLGDGNVSLVDTTLKAGGLSAIAGGSLDLSGATVNVTNTTQLVAGYNGVNNGVPNPLKAKDIILSGINMTTGVFEASAGGNIHNGGTTGTLKANALSVLAGKAIDLSSTDITVGTGTVPGIPGDTVAIGGLLFSGIGPASLSPNATFIAGGSLTLGNLSMTGSYLYLQAASVAILGKVTVPTGTVVQVAPIDPTASIGFEDKPGSGSDFNLSNSGFLSLFPEITLLLGTSAQTGNITLGGNGNIDIGADNLVVATAGTITGLDKITSTGLVTSLMSILGPPVPPPTSGEIDPNSGNNTGNKKHGEQTGGIVTGTGTDTLIEHDNAPPSGTCH
jgi:filamentous hemagglutinin family protein